MKLPHVLLLTGVALMAAAFVVPQLLGGQAALRGQLQRELVTAGELHMAAAHAHDDSAAAAARAAHDDLQRRVEAALNRGQGTARVLKWCGIGCAGAGVVMLLLNKSKPEGG